MAYNVFKDTKYKTLPQKNKNTVTYKGKGYSVAPSKQDAFLKQQREVAKKAKDKSKSKSKSKSSKARIGSYYKSKTQG
jgi:deoxyxylulose-5-phosphate synthase